MKKYILGIILTMGSFSALAGGAWQPSVGPGECISFQSGLGEIGGYRWVSSNGCNEVINRGYALGVALERRVNYANGDSVSSAGVISPSRDYVMKGSKFSNGSPKVSTGGSSPYWYK
ncbi:hypothetical protein [Escherichia coli]|nr:hypothetical protein [Escherichia coli]ATB11769.1 hypothetical protein CJU64_27255 [Escherichia coli]EFD1589028.1 hypothetical protein [Escherichia coli]EFD5425742.1 hypothetical protein [Escherichia coli]EJR8264106.1 hypothetical protein [Escherichia coli]UJY24023.1 hypothetical protein HB144_25355 [Escherichia coli]